MTLIICQAPHLLDFAESFQHLLVLLIDHCRFGHTERLDDVAMGAGNDDGAVMRIPYYPPAFICQSASTAPVGSLITLNRPMSGISVTSLQTVAPRDFAFSVAAATSSTRT